MTCAVYIATSVDGYIARADGDIEWLHRPEYAEAKLEGLSYEQFVATVDAIVIGRHTFEKVLTFGGWPYEDMPVVVLSNSGVEIPSHLTGKVSVDSGAPEEIVSMLKKEGRRNLYIDGGITIQRFLAAGLIDQLTITRIPILLGRGIPLFGSDGAEQSLRLVDVAASENGMVQERYEVV